MTPPECVAVLRFSALGDVLLTAPALDALRAAWPRTRIVFAVKERLAHLVRHSPHVDDVVPLGDRESPWSLARRLRERGVGAVLDLHGKMRSKAVRALLPGIPHVVWHKRDLLETLRVKVAFRRYRAPMHFADRYHAAVERLVGRTLARGALRYHLGPDDRRRAAEVLDAAGVDPARPLLGLSPGAAWATKRWPADRFGELARRASDLGYQVAVQGTEEERALGAAVLARAPRAIDLCGRLDLPALGGFLDRCAAFVANDSGPMHMARALGVPTLALFGSTDPGMFDFGGHAALFAGVACSPCSFFGRRRCPRRHFRCMLDLAPEQAWRALVPLLQAGRLPPLTA